MTEPRPAFGQTETLHHLEPGCTGYWVVEPTTARRSGVISCTECGRLVVGTAGLKAEAERCNRGQLLSLMSGAMLGGSAGGAIAVAG